MWCEKNNSCKDQTIEDKTEYLPSTLLVNFSRWETKEKDQDLNRKCSSFNELLKLLNLKYC